MSELSPDALKTIYLAVIGIFTIFLAWSGWRQGALRQLMTLLAIVSAYLMAWYAGGQVAPLFEFLRYPEPVTRIIGSFVAGLATFLAIRTLRLLFFKRTAQQKPGALRNSSAFLGALLGVVFGGVLLILSSDIIRMLGAIASMHVKMAAAQKHQLPPPAAVDGQPPAPPAPPMEEPNARLRGLAKLSDALDTGSTGDFLKRYDPVPTKVYATVAKLALMVANPDALNRFLAYPGVEKLAHHPKLIALRNDPGVSALLASNSYLKLLRHEKVVSLASDPEFAAEIRKVNFDEALNAALKTLPGGGL
jgi:uncharacterized membrane protein required for colicin V production